MRAWLTSPGPTVDLERGIWCASSPSSVNEGHNSNQPHGVVGRITLVIHINHLEQCLSDKFPRISLFFVLVLCSL